MGIQGGGRMSEQRDTTGAPPPREVVQVISALAALAARPLHEASAQQMRRALATCSASVREALSRNRAGERSSAAAIRPRLAVLPPVSPPAPAPGDPGADAGTRCTDGAA
jgi:hypothetical protein